MLGNKFKTLLAIGLVSSATAFGPIASAQAPRENPQSATSHQGTRYVKASAVNVRGGPGTRHSVVTVLNLGAEVSIYLVQGDWARISAPNKPEQWVYAPLLQDSKPTAPSQKHSTKTAAPATPKAQPVAVKKAAATPTHNQEPQPKTHADGSSAQPDTQKDPVPAKPN